MTVHLLIPLLIIAMLFYVWRGGAKYLFVAPIFGVAMGSIMWAISAMLWNSLITFHAYGWFLFVGVLIAEILAVFID